MRLFLGGGGDIEDSVIIDKDFFENITSCDKILYIPVACDFTSYENCFEWFYSLVNKYVNMNKNNITMLLETDNIPNLEDYKGIYIGGGNTYKLLDYVVKNNLAPKFNEYIKKGGNIFGGSAGAIIFGQSIETVIEEKENFPNNKGLGWLSNYTIRCHYKVDEDEIFKDISKKINYPVIALPENSGIIINYLNNTTKILGNSFVFINGNKEKLDNLLLK